MACAYRTRRLMITFFFIVLLLRCWKIFFGWLILVGLLLDQYPPRHPMKCSPSWAKTNSALEVDNSHPSLDGSERKETADLDNQSGDELFSLITNSFLFTLCCWGKSSPPFAMSLVNSFMTNLGTILFPRAIVP